MENVLENLDPVSKSNLKWTVWSALGVCISPACGNLRHLLVFASVSSLSTSRSGSHSVRFLTPLPLLSGFPWTSLGFDLLSQIHHLACFTTELKGSNPTSSISVLHGKILLADLLEVSLTPLRLLEGLLRGFFPLHQPTGPACLHELYSHLLDRLFLGWVSPQDLFGGSWGRLGVTSPCWPADL